MQKQQLTLLELNTNVQETIKEKFSDAVWVVAEISELKINRNGHCYLELIEKDAINEHIVAKARATIWAFTFRMLKPYFETTTGYELSSGIKVLLKVNVEFHELYGFSLNIIDIDPTYTLGDLARKKAEIIHRLEEDGVINMNKELNLPLLPQRIAVISSKTAAGYQDFMDQLLNNPYNYKFYLKLFPAIMQGQQAEESIISSLEKIFDYEDFFDLVVIIRGGGSQSDLSCFDSYQMASNVAQFPLPVLTGIGHEKDESVIDIVANKKLKTPTAVAEFIIDQALEFDQKLNYYNETALDLIIDYNKNQNLLLNQYSSYLSPLVKAKIEKQNSHLDIITGKVKNHIYTKIELQESDFRSYIKRIRYLANKYIYNQQSKLKLNGKIINQNLHFYFVNNTAVLKHMESRLELLKPENILKRGYSITYFNNKVVKEHGTLKEKDVIITKLFNGYLRSTIQSKSDKKQ